MTCAQELLCLLWGGPEVGVLRDWIYSINLWRTTGSAFEARNGCGLSFFGPSTQCRKRLCPQSKNEKLFDILAGVLSRNCSTCVEAYASPKQTTAGPSLLPLAKNAAQYDRSDHWPKAPPTRFSRCKLCRERCFIRCSKCGVLLSASKPVVFLNV